jgi:hypothetical protein
VVRVVIPKAQAVVAQKAPKAVIGQGVVSRDVLGIVKEAQAQIAPENVVIGAQSALIAPENAVMIVPQVQIVIVIQKDVSARPQPHPILIHRMNVDEKGRIAKDVKIKRRIKRRKRRNQSYQQWVMNMENMALFMKQSKFLAAFCVCVKPLLKQSLLDSIFTKEAEFQAWLIEVKGENIEILNNNKRKEMFIDFMEDYNTATMPHEK